MGISSVVKVAIELKKAGLFENIESVIDMGSQEIHLKYDDFIYLMESYGVEFEIKDFENLKNWPGSPRMSTKPFWRTLGLKVTDNLDINNQHGSIYCNLNLPFDNKDYLDKYDLVTDFGNNEHPFNVAEAYRTMHRLGKKGAYLWIDQAIFNGNGYFNFDLSFFEGMAAANNYGIIYSAFVIDTQDGGQYHIPCPREVLDLFDFGKINYIGVNYLFRKSSTEDFKYPIQGMPDSNNPNKTYKVSYVANKFPPERYYIPSNIELNGRYLIKEFIKKIKQKIV